jgi:hypothetical protein
MGIDQKERGAVSLFIVIFAALLITVVTVGFIRLMLADQRQASDNDLSQSAYDSAQAGIEDAKRALLRYQNICSTGTPVACSTAYNEVVAATSSNKCNQGLVHIIDPSFLSGNEVPVVSQNGTASLSQAYTCVIIDPITDDYLGLLGPNSSKLVPLKGTSDISSVTIEWYDKSNISNQNLSVNLLANGSIPQGGIPTGQYPPLYDQTANGWGSDRPSIMRAQLMQFGTQFKLTDFDDTNAAGQSNANTLFLYPTGSTGSAAPVTNDTFSFSAKDDRLTGVGLPLPVACRGSIATGGYACTVTLTLPTPVGGTGAAARTAYLRLTSLYNGSNYRVTLKDSSGADVKFNGVQPEIDSTGRANDLFRRVRTRVELIDTNFAYPEAAVDITGNLCKNFTVTGVAAEYRNTTTCTP